MSSRRSVWAAFAALLLSAVAASCLLGSVPIPVSDLAWGLVRRLHLLSWVGSATEPRAETPAATIFFALRLPRVLLAVVCGASLSFSGGVMQGVFRNPLADPYILGQAGGASLGAALVVLAGAGGSLLWLPLGAFAGAFAVTLALLLLSEFWAQLYFDPGSLILVGVALGSMCSALTGIVLFAGQTDQTGSLVFWLFGSFSASQWSQLAVFTLLAVPTVAGLLRHTRALDLLALGDLMALHLGIEVSAHKRRLLLLSSVLTALVVAVAGAIGFVGLVVPHIVRRLLGPTHKKLLVASVLLGGAFLPLCDALARTLFAPVEIPVGIITALVGVPFFVSLLLRRVRGVSEC